MRQMLFLARSPFPLAALFVVIAGRLCLGQACLDTAGFVRLSGSDTIAIEGVLSESRHTSGKLFLVSDNVRITYSADLADYPRKSTLTLAMWRGDNWANGAPDQEATLGMLPDSAVTIVRHGDSVQVQRNKAPAGALPGFQLATGLEELVVRQARRVGRDTASIPVFFVATDGWAPVVRVQFIGRDSATVEVAGTHWALRVDGAGRILAGAIVAPEDALHPVRVERIPCDALDRLLSRH